MTFLKTGLVAAASLVAVAATMTPTSAEAHGWGYKRHYKVYHYGYRPYGYYYSYRPVWHFHGYKHYRKW